jgi:hypothetical protein
LTLGFPSLKEMVECELARRQDNEDLRPAFCFIVHDVPGGLADVDEAVKAIVEVAENDGNWAKVCVTRAIGEAVIDALQAAHPKRCVISHPIVSPGQSQEQLARLDIDYEPERIADAADRAAERISRMRENAK